MTDENRLDFYADYNQTQTGLKERIDPSNEIQRVIDTFAGVERDKYGKETPNSRKYPVMNDEGCSRTKGFLYGMVTKITHLAKYQNEERINRQTRHFCKEWVKIIVKNRKKWNIIDREVVLSEIENFIYESKTRANDGFEASITGKAHQVSEIIQQQNKEENRGISWMRRRNNDVY